jgi:hypothetical protein
MEQVEATLGVLYSPTSVCVLELPQHLLPVISPRC